MRRYTKFIALLLALFVIGRIVAFFGSVEIAKRYGIDIPYEISSIWRGVSMILFHLVNIGAAFWLFVESGRFRSNRWIWGLTGLVFGLLGIIVYYVTFIARDLEANGNQKHNKTDHPMDIRAGVRFFTPLKPLNPQSKPPLYPPVSSTLC